MIHLFSSDLILENEVILLRPSSLDDLTALSSIADPDIWKHISQKVNNTEQLRLNLQTAIEEREQEVKMLFTIIEKENGRLIGNTSFCNIAPLPNKRVEIGWTWLGKDFQGKGYNKHVKFLMLQFIFEKEQFERVEFRTRGLNLQSQKALSKIGATKEGTFRNYLIENGIYFDVIYYSILSREWPEIKATIFKAIPVP
jgi:RimJ/RimL family protein N-acetyltransferase